MIRLRIIKSLPELTHEVEVASVKQAMANTKRLRHSCTIGILQTDERQQFISFSKPVFYAFPHRLILRKSDREKFIPFLTSDGEIDLEKLLKKDQLQFGYVKNRIYGSVNALIRNYAHNKTSFGRSAADLTKGLLQMLSLKRIDYILEYSSMVQYIKEEQKIKTDFYQFPIKDSSELLPVYIGCSKSDEGKWLIKKIDSLTKTYKKEYADAYAQWLSSEEQKAYEQALETIK